MTDGDAGEKARELYPVRDRTYGKRLRESRPFFRGLKKLLAGERRERGIRMLSGGRIASGVSSELQTVSQLPGSPYGAASAMMKCGVPVTFSSGDIVFASGDALVAAEEEQIRSLLSGAMLLDADSVGILLDRGFGALVGLKGRELLDTEAMGTPVMQEILWQELPYAGERLPIEPLTSIQYVRHRPAKECTVVTEIFNEYGRAICPGLIWYENDFGGRVAILPITGGWDVCFACTDYRQRRRKDLLYETLKWLGRGQVDLFVGGSVPVLPTRTDTPQGVVLSIQNISASTMFRLDMEVGHLPGQFGKLSRLDYAGWLTQVREARISQLDSTAVRISLGTNLPFYGLEVLVLAS